MCNARSGGSGRKMTTSGPISGVSVGSNSSGGQSAIASEWFSWFAQHRNLGKKGQHTQVGWQTFIFISSSLVEKLVWKKHEKRHHHQLGASKFLRSCFVKQKVLSINCLCRAQRMAPNKMGRIKNCRHPLCFGTTGADARRVNIVQKLRKKARHRFFEENRGLFLPGSSRIGTTLPKNRDHPQYILQTLPIPKSDLISFISFQFWHLSTLSEKLQLKENDGLFFFALEPSFSKTRGFPILNRDWAKQRIQLDQWAWGIPKKRWRFEPPKKKPVRLLSTMGKKHPGSNDSWWNLDVLGVVF